MIRPPVVAGQFYPGDVEPLRSFLGQAIPLRETPRDVVGVVSPHAGYVYSGRVAGAVFGAVRVPDAVLLLGPNHTGLGTAASIMSSGAWQTPLGTVPVDEALAAALKAACPLLEEDARAHAREHSLEVQLPFLQFRNPGVRVVPVAFMLRTFAEIARVGAAIADTLGSWPDPVLIVASSDMTHYESAAAARDKDRRAIDRIVALDAEGLYDTVRSQHISMCGVIPATAMLAAAGGLGATRGELVRYATSGDVTGEEHSVVGYAGALVY